MSNHEKTKWASFTAIAMLAGLLIVIINAHTLFSEILFYSIVMILISIIAVLVVYAFLWTRTVRYSRNKMWRRKMNSSARNYFDDFRDFVERFTLLREFHTASEGIKGILGGLQKKAPKGFGVLIDNRSNDFISILQNPLNALKQRLNNLQWNKKEVNYEFLSSLAREFENYVMLHKRLYVDFAVTMARRIGNVSEATKRSYSDYKDDYNQFIIAYTDFAKRCSKERLRIFNEKLEKAYEL